jgi:hypothetical protein
MHIATLRLPRRCWEYSQLPCLGVNKEKKEKKKKKRREKGKKRFEIEERNGN